jgi:chromosome segregation ATPase
MSRDWQKDMLINLMQRTERAKADGTIEYVAIDFNALTALIEEAAAEKEHADIAELAYQGLAEIAVTRGEYQSLLDKHTAMTKAYRAEKARADKLQSDYDLIETNFNRLKDDRDFWEKARTKHKERADKAEAREQKLREAIETAINEKAAWGDPGNALDVVTRYLADTLESLYLKEGTE